MNDFLDSGNYLPKPLRDFHDAKDVFKTIHHLTNLEKFPPQIKEFGWINAQIYVIDVFLWFMAKRGYTLQKSRRKENFRSLEDDIKARQLQEKQAFKTMLDARK